MAAGTTFEGFSISHAAILTSTGAQQSWGDVYAVRSGSLDINTDSYDNTGDEAVLSTWYWFNYATVTIQGGYVPFDTIAGLSGGSITSSGVASTNSDYYSVPLWNDAYLNQPRYPMVIRVPSKDTAGTTRTFDFVLYNVQFEPFGFDGPTYKNGLLINYSGRALMSTTDEAGSTLAGGMRAIGRIINRPPITGTQTYSKPSV